MVAAAHSTHRSRWEQPYAKMACCHEDDIKDAVSEIFQDQGSRRKSMAFVPPETKGRTTPELNEIFDGIIMRRQPFGSSQSKVFISYYKRVGPNRTVEQPICEIITNGSDVNVHMRDVTDALNRVVQGDIFGLTQDFGKDVVDASLVGRSVKDEEVEKTLITAKPFLDFAKVAYERAINNPNIDPTRPTTRPGRAADHGASGSAGPHGPDLSGSTMPGAEPPGGATYSVGPKERYQPKPEAYSSPNWGQRIKYSMENAPFGLGGLFEAAFGPSEQKKRAQGVPLEERFPNRAGYVEKVRARLQAASDFRFTIDDILVKTDKEGVDKVVVKIKSTTLSRVARMLQEEKEKERKAAEVRERQRAAGLAADPEPEQSTRQGLRRLLKLGTLAVQDLGEKALKWCGAKLYTRTTGVRWVTGEVLNLEIERRHLENGVDGADLMKRVVNAFERNEKGQQKSTTDIVYSLCLINGKPGEPTSLSPKVRFQTLKANLVKDRFQPEIRPEKGDQAAGAEDVYFNRFKALKFFALNRDCGAPLMYDPSRENIGFDLHFADGGSHEGLVKGLAIRRIPEQPDPAQVGNPDIPEDAKTRCGTYGLRCQQVGVYHYEYGAGQNLECFAGFRTNLHASLTKVIANFPVVKLFMHHVLEPHSVGEGKVGSIGMWKPIFWRQWGAVCERVWPLSRMLAGISGPLPDGWDTRLLSVEGLSKQEEGDPDSAGFVYLNGVFSRYIRWRTPDDQNDPQTRALKENYEKNSRYTFPSVKRMYDWYTKEEYPRKFAAFDNETTVSAMGLHFVGLKPKIWQLYDAYRHYFPGEEAIKVIDGSRDPQTGKMDKNNLLAQFNIYFGDDVDSYIYLWAPPHDFMAMWGFREFSPCFQFRRKGAQNAVKGAPIWDDYVRMRTRLSKIQRQITDREMELFPQREEPFAPGYDNLKWAA